MLPLQIPVPLFRGKPANSYPWPWSIYRWIEGESAASRDIDDLNQLAADLAAFLQALQSIDSAKGLLPGLHSFYRGGALTTYDSEVKRALGALTNKIDIEAATEVWKTALNFSWHRGPVWVHGDISPGNLLLHKGRLCAVIDFGQLATGDPSCDLAITWTLFQGHSRQIFRKALGLDRDTWARARGWTLWKALIVAADLTSPSNSESSHCWRIIDEVIDDHDLQKG